MRILQIMKAYICNRSIEVIGLFKSVTDRYSVMITLEKIEIRKYALKKVSKLCRHTNESDP